MTLPKNLMLGMLVLGVVSLLGVGGGFWRYQNQKHNYPVALFENFVKAQMPQDASYKLVEAKRDDQPESIAVTIKFTWQNSRSTAVGETAYCEFVSNYAFNKMAGVPAKFPNAGPLKYDDMAFAAVSLRALNFSLKQLELLNSGDWRQRPNLSAPLTPQMGEVNLYDALRARSAVN